MNKKNSFLVLIGLMTIFGTGAVKANIRACGYKDYFHIDAPITTRIMSLTNDSGVTVSQDSINTFTIHDAPSCPPGGGHVSVIYGKDANNFCELNIHDSELMWDPEVMVKTCKGNFIYKGVTL